MWTDLVPVFGNFPLIVFTAAPAPKLFRMPRAQQTLPSHCFLSGECGWGAGGHPTDTGSKAARWGKRPAQSWLGSQQAAGPLTVWGCRGMNGKMGMAKRTNRK